MNQRTRTWLMIGGGLASAALLAWAGMGLTQRPPTTAAEVGNYANSINISRLSATQRNEAIRKLEEKVNGLSLEERRKWWAEGQWHNWFDQMTEGEKGDYIDATLPTGFKQVLNAFENLPDERRHNAIDQAMRQLKATHKLVTDHEPGHPESMYGTNPPPVLSPDLENRARMTGFKTFYTESTAQIKVELAPLIVELQHQLENGTNAGL